MDINNKILPCHLFIYLHLFDSPSTPIITKYGTISMPGHYVLIHSVAENVFQDVPTTHLYKTKNPDLMITNHWIIIIITQLHLKAVSASLGYY